MIKSTHLYKKRKEKAFIIISLSILIFALLTILPAAASVNSWEISPEKPTLGDTLKIKGSASPEEEVEIKVTFEKEVPVSEGEYEYTLEDVKIPEGFNNRFTVEASEASDLNVRVKMLVWITKSSEASGDTATVTQSSVPPGTYQIKMDGNAKGETSTVNLKITAVQQIKADSKGDFSYSYNTKAVPPGDFEVSVGGSTKKITLQQKRTSAVISDHSSQETESVTEQKPSETQEETKNIEIVPNTNQSTEQEENKGAPKSQPVKEEGLSNTVYMLGGMVAAILILILYSKRN